MKSSTSTQKKITVNGTILKMVKGDLVQQNVEAIVNAANPMIEGGGGVDGRIHSTAGPELADACRHYKKEHKIDKIQVGHAIITDSFDIKTISPSIQYVIHTVGPDCRIASQWDEKESLLMGAYINSLEVAREKKIASIAFPAISTGAYNYPFWEAQTVVVETVKKYLENKPQGVFTEVRLVYYTDEELGNALRVWEETFQ